MTSSLSDSTEPTSLIRPILISTLIVGVLDIGEVLLYFAFRGVSPIRILHSIASGVLGKEAFAGGRATAALGLALHFVIAFGVVVTYVILSSRLPALHHHPILAGVVYGLTVYAVMKFVVLPLSAVAGNSRFSWAGFANTIFAHIVCVGLPTTLYWSARARRAAARTTVAA